MDVRHPRWATPTLECGRWLGSSSSQPTPGGLGQRSSPVQGHISVYPSSWIVVSGIDPARDNWRCSPADIECSGGASATTTRASELVVPDISMTLWDKVSVHRTTHDYEVSPIKGASDCDFVGDVGLASHTSDSSAGCFPTLGVVGGQLGFNVPTSLPAIVCSGLGFNVPTISPAISPTSAYHSSGSFTFHQSVLDSGHGSADHSENLSG